MIRIYDNTCQDFDNNGLGILTDFKTSPQIIEELNGVFELNFDYSRKGKNAEFLVIDNIIKAPYETSEQLFRIKRVKPSLNKISVYAIHIFYDLNDNFLGNVAPTNQSGVNAIQWLFDHAMFPVKFTVTGDILPDNSAKYVRRNIVEAMLGTDNCIVNRWGGELERDNFNLILHKKRGQDRGVYIREGKNIKEIEISIDFSTVVTRIVPQGANELLLPEEYVDSPIISTYRNPIVKKIEFSDITVDEETSEAVAQEKLRDAARAKFAEGIDKPSISVSVNWLELSFIDEYKEKYSNFEFVRLGDTVTVYALGYEYKIRVIKVVYDCLMKKYISFEIGESKPDFIKDQIAAVTTEFEKNNTSLLEQARKNATTLINNGFGGHVRIYPDRILIMDTEDEATAKNVWQWNLNGFAHSSSGVNGDYGLAITIDGQIVADRITAGVMDIQRINGLANALGDITTAIELNEKNIKALTSETTENRKNIEDLNTPILTKYGNNHICLNEAYETDAISYNIIGKCEQNENPTSKNPIAIKTIKGTTDIDVNHEGNWSKIKVTGKNLLNLETMLRNTSNGLTNNINEDGSVTTSGVITSNYVGITDKVSIDEILTDNEYYTISQKEISDKLFLQIEETNKITHAVKNYSTQNKLSNTLKINKDLYSYKIVILTNTMSNWGTEEKSITNFYQLEKGDESTDYERYKEKEIFVDINKPNLFSFFNIIEKSNINEKGEIISDSSQSFDVHYVKVIPKKKYKIIGDNERQFVLSFYKDIPKIGSVGTSRVVKSDTFSEIVTVPDDYNYLAIRHGMDALTTEDNSNLKIHEGHDSFYELNSIKEVSDDLESSQGVLEKRIGKIVLDGTAGIFTVPGNSNENFIQINLQFPNIEFQCSSIGDEFLCTHFSYYEKATSTGKEREGLKLFNSGTYYAFVFSISTTIATTIEEFKNWLKENPITIYYILKEPETIHLRPTKIPLFENENHLTLIEEIETKTDIKYHRIHAFNEAFYTKDEAKSQLEIKANEINMGVESNKTEIKNGLLEINEKLGNYALQQTLIEQINSVLAKITDSEARINILNQTIQNGVPITKTETGYTFDINGLNIASTDAEVNSTLSSIGLSILDNISKEALLFAGYDKILQETIVKARNMIVEKYFTVAHTRMEEFKDPVLGIGTGFFCVE